jgi:ubiquinone/menaquinone biosynthesis C-methylase UbiE
MNSELRWWDKNMTQESVAGFLQQPWEGIENGERIYFRNWLSKLKPYPKMVDLGCGGGIELLGYLLEGVDVNYTGVDFSEVMIEFCKVRFKKFNFVKVDIINTGLSDGEFEIVLCRHVLEHQEYYYDIVREAKRLSSEYVIIDFYRELKDVDTIVPWYDIWDNRYEDAKFRTFLNDEKLEIIDEQKFHYETFIPDRCDHLFILRKVS